MHPVAATDENQIPNCARVIKELKQCHSKQTLLTKLFSKGCDFERIQLDRCLRVNKEIRRRTNYLTSSRFTDEDKERFKIEIEHIKMKHKDLLG